MAKTTRLNVAVTANTRSFDHQMRKMSQRIKKTRAEASGAAGGLFSAVGVGGGFGAGAGMALRGGPLLLALGGLTMVLQKISNDSKKQSQQGRKDLAEAAALALDPARQMEARVASQLIKGEGGTAADIVGAQRGLRASLEDRKTRRRLERDGFDVGALADLADTVDISDFTEKLIQFSKGLNDGSRLFLAEQLGGKTGEMLLGAAGVQRTGNISSAIDQAVNPSEIVRALLERENQENATLRASGGVSAFTELGDLVGGWFTAGMDQSRVEAKMQEVVDELKRQNAVMTNTNPAGV